MSRGDIVRLPTHRRARGHEQRGARYGVIVQSDRFQLLSTVIVAPTSRSAQPGSFRPKIRLGDTDTLVLPQQIRAMDRSTLGDPVDRVTPAELDEIDDALRLILNLPRG